MGRTALNVSDSMVAGITSSHVNGGFNREVFNDLEAQVSAAGEIEALNSFFISLGERLLTPLRPVRSFPGGAL